jgi:hypothetical protein
MSDELMIIGGLDQGISGGEEVLDWIEEIIEKSFIEKNVHIGLSACKGLVGISKKSGLALAKGLYLLRENWELFELDDPFYEFVYPEVGLHPTTVDRYIEVWEMLSVAPEDVRGRLKDQNIKSLIPIAKTVKQGYQIDEDGWNKLADAPDFTSVAKICREDIKGQEPRKSALQIYVDHIGTLWAWKAGERFYVGSLEIDDDTEPVQQAINRITKNAGVLRQ